jgi:hypothetical protein
MNKIVNDEDWAPPAAVNQVAMHINRLCSFRSCFPGLLIIPLVQDLWTNTDWNQSSLSEHILSIFQWRTLKGCF